MPNIEGIIAKLREDCCQANRNGDELCLYPITYGDARQIIAEIDRLTAERDAAVRDISDFYTLPDSCACDFCKHAIVSPEPQECIDCIGGLKPRSKFEWRGVQS